MLALRSGHGSCEMLILKIAPKWFLWVVSLLLKSCLFKFTELTIALWSKWQELKAFPVTTIMSQAVVTELYDVSAKPKKVWHSWITRFSSMTIHEGIKAHPFLFSIQPCWFQVLQYQPPSNTLNKKIFLCSHSKMCEILPTPVYTINTLVESKKAAT